MDLRLPDRRLRQPLQVAWVVPVAALVVDLAAEEQVQAVAAVWVLCLERQSQVG